MDKTNKILMLSFIVLTGFFVAVVFHYILGYYLSAGYPFNTFLFNPHIAISDFTDLLPLVKNFAPYSQSEAWQPYFPLAYLMMVPFAFIKNKVLSYFLFASIFLVAFVWANIRFFKCENLTKLENFQNIFILTCVSYPFLVLIDRGNLDMIIFIIFAAFVWFLKSKKYQKAAIFLGIINAMKPFSWIFLSLFLFEKKYREFFLSIGISFLFIFGGFILFKGGVLSQIDVLLESWVGFQKHYVFSVNAGLSNNSSLYMALKFLFCQSAPIFPTVVVAKLYKIISLLITIPVLFFTWREKIFWKKIALLTFYMLIIPYFTYDYKLIFLFIPLWLFVNAKGKSKFDFIYTILFGLLLIPKKFIVIWGLKLSSLSIVLNPLIILFFMILILSEQFLPEYKKGIERE